MKIIVDAEPKEIAAFVVAIQERQERQETKTIQLNVDVKELEGKLQPLEKLCNAFVNFQHQVIPFPGVPEPK